MVLTPMKSLNLILIFRAYERVTSPFPHYESTIFDSAGGVPPYINVPPQRLSFFQA